MTLGNHWANNHPFALALSHDVDRVAKRWQFFYYLPLTVWRGQPTQFRQHLQSLQARLKGDDPYWNFERIMALEEGLEVRSTFFFLNESGRAKLLKPRSYMLFWGRYRIDDQRIQEVIRHLHAGGWEIGLHGSYHSYRDEALLRLEKEKLESIVGAPVRSTRQHYLNLEVPETWRIHASVGLLYDSTLGYANRIGLKWDTSHPFYPKDPLTGEQIPVLQIPLAIMDGPLMQTREPWSEALSLINRIEEVGGVLTLDWHQRVFNPWEFQAYQELYERIIRECQRRGAWVAPISTIAVWWEEQKGRISS